MSNLQLLVAAAIKESRINHGLQQHDLANMIGITRTSISNIERGKQAVSLAKFCKIADALSENPGHFLNKILSKRGMPSVNHEEVEDPHIRMLIKKTLEKN